MTLILFLFILGLLIVVHEFGHFIMAKYLGVRVETFSLGFGKRLFSKKKNDTEYIVCALPLGGYVKLAGDSLEEYKGKPDEYFSKSPQARGAIVLFGPVFNYILGFLFFWFIFFAGYPTFSTKVGGFVEGLPAEKSGMQIGDKIVAIDDRSTNSWEELQRIIHNKKDATSVRISVLRNEQKYDFDLKIRQQQIDDPIGKRNVGLIGVTPYTDEIITVRYGIFKSFYLGIEKVGELTALTYKAIWRMITGNLSFKDSVTGPLGVFYITSQAARVGILAVLHLIAVLNISLAIFNLLPLPVLDGGHILLLTIERIRNKTLSLKAERVITQIGLTFIIGLALFVTYNDLMRFKDNIYHFFVK